MKNNINEKRDAVSKMFGGIAHRYDLMNTLMSLGMHKKWSNHAARVATIGLEGAALDVGTGTGDLAFAMANQPGINSVVGMDISPQMISKTKLKLKNLNPKIPINFSLGDALSLPFADNTFICVTSAYTLRNVPDVPLSLKEMMRVLKPGGRLLSLEILPIQNRVFRRFFKFYFNSIVPLLGTLITGHRRAYTYLPSSVDQFLFPNKLAAIFSDTGLEDVEYKRLWLGNPVIHSGMKPL